MEMFKDGEYFYQENKSSKLSSCIWFAVCFRAVRMYLSEKMVINLKWGDVDVLLVY